jgi:hypothetical protein
MLSRTGGTAIKTAASDLTAGIPRCLKLHMEAAYIHREIITIRKEMATTIHRQLIVILHGEHL